MYLEPYRTTCDSCLTDTICAGFKLYAPSTEVWVCEKCCKNFSSQIHKKKLGLVVNRGESPQKGIPKKRKKSGSRQAA